MEMINTAEFDKLEDDIEEQGVPLGKLQLIYRNFLLNLIENGKLNMIPADLLKETSNFIIAVNLGNFDESEIEKRLWQIANLHNKTHPDIYNFVRCCLLTFGDESEWENAPDPFIFYCMLFLRRIISDIEPDIIKYFYAALFLQNE